MIRNFREIRKEDVAVAGGKGANLGEMTHFGIAVPEGFVVTSKAYERFLEENGLTDYFAAELEKAGNDETQLVKCAETFREKIRQGQIPEDICEAVREHYRELGEKERVAVRSSATAEDLPDASFAGQQETYLNVQGEEELLSQIRNCYASLWGNRAVIYRQNYGYDQRSVALAVVVQRMVESDVAGGLFTVNPIGGNHDQMQVNASYGLGESVVSGRVTADTYICDKQGKLLEHTLGSKATQIIYAAEGGTKEVAVSQEMRTKRALSDALLKNLCAEAKKVEDYYGMPMDIEWGIHGGQIYILQARAITTLKETDSAEEEALVAKYMAQCKCTGMQRENMAFMLEKIPYAYLPMDYELIEIIDDQKSVIFAEAGIIMDGHPQVDDNGITILPPNGKKIGKNIVRFPKVLKEIMNLEHCEQILREGMPEYKRKLNKFVRTDYDKLALTDCGLYMKKMREYLRDLTYFRFKYALFSSAVAKMKLERQLHKADPSYTAYDLYQNLENETSLMSRDLEKLGEQLAQNEAVKQAVESGMKYRQLRETFPETEGFFDDFLAKHGYKSDYNCYCTIARTFYEEPDRMLQLAKPLMAKLGSDGMVPVETSGEKQAENGYETLMRKLKQAVGDKKYERLKKEIEIFRYLHVIREESQLMWETEFFYTRKLLEQVSELLFGTKDYSKDLVYLFSTELIAVCKKGGLTPEYEEKIRRRKERRPLAEKVWDAAKLKVFPDTGDVLKGVSGSIGEVVGRVCVVNGPEEFYKFQKGDVLVCKLTDPEWTPLFSLAAAVVADTGAALSHAAIVAREYGIPAVLGVGHATTKYRDGDMIRVNGTKGEVSKVG